MLSRTETTADTGVQRSFKTGNVIYSQLGLLLMFLIVLAAGGYAVLVTRNVNVAVRGIGMKDRRSGTVTTCICLLFAIMIVGCGSTDTKESTWEYIDDSVITANVKALIYDDPDLKISRISVKTYKGVVLLSGFVNSSMAVAEAESHASLVKGVVYVKNSLVLN